MEDKDKVYCKSCAYMQEGSKIRIEGCTKRVLVNRFTGETKKVIYTHENMSGQCPYFAPKVTITGKKSLWEKIFGAVRGYEQFNEGWTKEG